MAQPLGRKSVHQTTPLGMQQIVQGIVGKIRAGTLEGRQLLASIKQVCRLPRAQAMAILEQIEGNFRSQMMSPPGLVPFSQAVRTHFTPKPTVPPGAAAVLRRAGKGGLPRRLPPLKPKLQEQKRKPTEAEKARTRQTKKRDRDLGLILEHAGYPSDSPESRVFRRLILGIAQHIGKSALGEPARYGSPVFNRINDTVARIEQVLSSISDEIAPAARNAIVCSRIINDVVENSPELHATLQAPAIDPLDEDAVQILTPVMNRLLGYPADGKLDSGLMVFFVNAINGMVEDVANTSEQQVIIRDELYAQMVSEDLSPLSLGEINNVLGLSSMLIDSYMQRAADLKPVHPNEIKAMIACAIRSASSNSDLFLDLSKLSTFAEEDIDIVHEQYEELCNDFIHGLNEVRGALTYHEDFGKVDISEQVRTGIAQFGNALRANLGEDQGQPINLFEDEGQPINLAEDERQTKNLAELLSIYMQSDHFHPAGAVYTDEQILKMCEDAILLIQKYVTKHEKMPDETLANRYSLAVSALHVVAGDTPPVATEDDFNRTYELCILDGPEANISPNPIDMYFNDLLNLQNPK